MYSILIVEDEPIIRRGIASLIDFESLGISTVQEVEKWGASTEKIREEAPDILLTDINMPKNGWHYSCTVGENRISAK